MTTERDYAEVRDQARVVALLEAMEPAVDKAAMGDERRDMEEQIKLAQKRVEARWPTREEGAVVDHATGSDSKPSAAGGKQSACHDREEGTSEEGREANGSGQGEGWCLRPRDNGHRRFLMPGGRVRKEEDEAAERGRGEWREEREAARRKRGRGDR